MTNTKLAYQTDKNGWFVGVVEADESPLEKGVWHYPFGAVNIEPPISQDPTKHPRYINGSWILDDIPKEEPTSFNDVEKKPDQFLQVSMRQARLILLSKGILDDVNSHISNLDKALQIEWEYATIVDRSSPLVVAIGSRLGLTDTEIDAMFQEASTL